MAITDSIDRLIANAARCRELAAKATDPEAADALLQVATDMEGLVLVLRHSADARNTDN